MSEFGLAGKKDVIDFYKIIGWCVKNKMNEVQFCEMAGLPPFTIGNIIGLNYREVTILDLVNIAKAMGVSVKDLLL